MIKCRGHQVVRIALALLTMFCGVAVITLKPSNDESARTYGGLKMGMTRADVEHVMGRPADLHAVERYATTDIWNEAEYRVVVLYDGSDKFWEVFIVRNKLSMIDRLRALIGW